MALDWTFYGNPLGDWAAALVVAAGLVAGLALLRRLAIRYLGRLARQTDNQWDDLAADVLRRTRFFFLLALGTYAGAALLELPPGPWRAVRAVAVLALVLQGAFWGNVVISFYVSREARRRLEEDAAGATTINALGFLGRLLLWAVLLLLGLDNLGVDITALVAGLGVGGIAVALAVQNILGDLFASLSIVLDRPFRIGDFIIVDDLMGTVEHIGLKTTRLRSLSGEQIVFSNADLLRTRVRNFKRMYERRVVFSVGVTYDTPYERLAAIPGMIRDIIEAQHRTRFDRSHFKAFGAFSLDFEVVYYVLDPDYNVYMDVHQSVNLEIFRQFAAEGIDFAYPTQTLYLRQAPATVPA
ncbi:MAG: mechanosensitive ion channel family protein [Gemmatimonadetes bacterium]|nr:mechanosensitive ion channel family protein [Gemmatimonadota bacterium]